MNAPIFTKEHFTEWVKKQPPRKRYPAHNGCDCALARYAKSLGYEDVRGSYTSVLIITKTSYYVARVEQHHILEDDNAISERPHTYGALAKRLEGKG